MHILNKYTDTDTWMSDLRSAIDDLDKTLAVSEYYHGEWEFDFTRHYEHISYMSIVNIGNLETVVDEYYICFDNAVICMMRAAKVLLTPLSKIHFHYDHGDMIITVAPMCVSDEGPLSIISDAVPYKFKIPMGEDTITEIQQSNYTWSDEDSTWVLNDGVPNTTDAVEGRR